MKKSIVFTILLSLFTAVLALDSNKDLSIMQALRSDSNFSTLVGLLDENGLSESLEQAGSLTLFAPTNEAFETYMSENTTNTESGLSIADILAGHVIATSYTLLNLQDADNDSIPSLQGEILHIENTAAGLHVNGVGFESNDVENEFSNGMVHVVEQVILPRSMMADMTDTDTTSTDDSTNTTANMAATGMAVAADMGDTAMIRVIHLSPNVPAINVALMVKDDSSLITQGFQNLSYSSLSDYQQVQAGDYLLRVTDVNNNLVLEKEVVIDEGHYYTLAAEGLLIPGENVNADDDTTGFVGWVRGLFSNENERDALALDVQVYNEDSDEVPSDKQSVRVINAAPGSTNFDVVAIRADGTQDIVMSNLSYQNESLYNDLDADVTGLELRIAGSDVVVVDLSEALAIGSAKTVFITGTELEQAPISGVIVSDTIVQ